MFSLSLSLSLSRPYPFLFFFFFCEIRSPTSERSENERFNLSADSRDRLFRKEIEKEREREREKTRVTEHEISTREIETRDHLTSKRRSTLSLTPFYICDVDGHWNAPVQVNNLFHRGSHHQKLSELQNSIKKKKEKKRKKIDYTYECVF